MLSIYSNAASKLTAQATFGVPASNFVFFIQLLNSSFFTQAIAQPQEIAGSILCINSSLIYKIHNQFSAITLCPVKNIASQFKALTSVYI
jgi:hypothetical protein